jgi:hypothetical protein
LQFQAHVQSHEIGGRRHGHHADRAEQHEHGEFEAVDALTLVVVKRQHGGEAAAGQDEELGVFRKGIVDEETIVGEAAIGLHDQRCGDDEGGQHRHGAHDRTVAALQNTEQQNGEAADSQEDFGESQGPVHAFDVQKREGLLF